MTLNTLNQELLKYFNTHKSNATYRDVWLVVKSSSV